MPQPPLIPFLVTFLPHAYGEERQWTQFYQSVGAAHRQAPLTVYKEFPRAIIRSIERKPEAVIQSPITA